MPRRPRYNRNLLEHARENRKQMTPAERKLWFEALRNRQLLGFKFQNQRPLGGAIADFYCAKLHLAIEVDGDTHAEAAQVIRDARRTEDLMRQGITVVRYTNRDVLHDLPGVVADLTQKIHTMMSDRQVPDSSRSRNRSRG